MLVSKVGGRYSTELGIDVDKGDAEVERWFLAVTLFHRHLTFDVLKNTFEVSLHCLTLIFSHLFLQANIFMHIYAKIFKQVITFVTYSGVDGQTFFTLYLLLFEVYLVHWISHLQKLGEAGIVSVGDTLHMEEDEVADLLETAGYTTYKHR